MKPKVKGETAVLMVPTVLVEVLVGGGTKENKGGLLTVSKVKAGATSVGAVTLVVDGPTAVSKVNVGVAVVVVLILVLVKGVAPN